MFVSTFEILQKNFWEKEEGVFESHKIHFVRSNVSIDNIFLLEMFSSKNQFNEKHKQTYKLSIAGANLLPIL